MTQLTEHEVDPSPFYWVLFLKGKNWKAWRKRAWDTIEAMPKGGGGWTAKRKFEERSETIRFLKTGKIEAELELILRFLVCRSKTL